MPPDPRADRDLLNRFRRRDRAAFDTLFARHGPAVFAFARRLTGSCADAEDLTQETFVAAFSAAERFGGRARLTTWLIAIALRRHRDRSRRSIPSLTPLDERHIEAGPTPEGPLLERLALERALARLDEPLRAAFLLVVGQGLRYAEAAEALGAPVGTVKWRVHEAIRRLRAILTEEHHETLSR